MDLKVVRYEAGEHIATITLNRPHRMNAWTGRMHAEYRWCLDKANRDKAVRVIIVTGSGRGFCVGAYAEALQGHIAKGGYDPGVSDDIPMPGYGVRPEFDELFAYHYGLDKPVLAAVNGPAAGVGLALACYADMRFAAAGAKLTTAHGKLGLPAEYGLSWVLPRLIGLTRAADILISSRHVLAEEAAAMGLVNAVYPAEDVLPRTREYAQMLIRSASPASMRVTRHQMYADLHRDVATSVREAEILLREMMMGIDYREGVAAFLEKRAPQFGDSES